MKIPDHVSALSAALDEYINAAVSHGEYVAHRSPQSSIDAACDRFLEAAGKFRDALGKCARAEGVAQ